LETSSLATFKCSPITPSDAVLAIANEHGNPCPNKAKEARSVSNCSRDRFLI
jgi:hypothetical protein